MIKKFIVNSLQEGKEKIQEEFGEDAVIISSRNIPDIDGNELIEIVALYQAGTSQLRQPDTQENGSESDNKDIKDINDSWGIIRELSSIKNLILELSENIKYKYSASLGSNFGRAYKLLLKNGFAEDYIIEMIGRITSKSLNNDFEYIISQIKKIITERIKIYKSPTERKERNIHLFLGPSGSGKTITLAKLAIFNKLTKKSKILIIGADTKKIGGLEQLQTYAQIADIPFLAAYSSVELNQIIASEIDYDEVFIDTSGINVCIKSNLEMMLEFIFSSHSSHSYLVLPANLDKASLLNLYTSYEFLRPDSIILSKIDETSVLGHLIEFLQKTALPVSYITDGSNVPDDMESATIDKILDLVLKDKP